MTRTSTPPHVMPLSKWAKTLATAAAMGAFLAGCGGSDPAATSTPPPATSATPTATPSATPTAPTEPVGGWEFAMTSCRTAMYADAVAGREYIENHPKACAELPEVVSAQIATQVATVYAEQLATGAAVPSFPPLPTVR